MITSLYFYGNKNDKRGYSKVKDFVKILLNIQKLIKI